MSKVENPNLNSLSKSMIPKVHIKIDIYFKYWITTGLSVVLAGLFKFIYSSSRASYTKSEYYTGIPILRKYFFLLPITMSFLLFFWLIFIFHTSTALASVFDKKLIKFLKKIRCGFFITNLILLLLFYVLYMSLYKPLQPIIHFKISGHSMASLLSGAMLIHISYICELFYGAGINRPLMEKVKWLCWFLLGHNIYTLFWSTLIYHTLQEIFLSLIINVSYILIIHLFNFDRLILNLLDTRNERIKAKNSIYIKSF